MGMFDYLVVEVALPDGTPPQDNDTITERDKYQTKSMDNVMDTYVITAKGELYVERYEYDWIEAPESLLGGYAETVPDSYRREYLTDYHGDLRFYTHIAEKTWREYTARFTDGKLSRMSYEDHKY